MLFSRLPVLVFEGLLLHCTLQIAKHRFLENSGVVNYCLLEISVQYLIVLFGASPFTSFSGVKNVLFPGVGRLCRAPYGGSQEFQLRVQWQLFCADRPT